MTQDFQASFTLTPEQTRLLAVAADSCGVTMRQVWEHAIWAKRQAELTREEAARAALKETK